MPKITNSSSSSYYYTYNSGRPTATIIVTKPSASTWSDVLEVAFGNYNYKIGDIVKIIRNSQEETGRIEALGPTAVTLACAYTFHRAHYDEILPSDVNVKPDPNRAFLNKRGDI